MRNRNRTENRDFRFRFFRFRLSVTLVRFSVKFVQPERRVRVAERGVAARRRAARQLRCGPGSSDIAGEVSEARAKDGGGAWGWWSTAAVRDWRAVGSATQGWVATMSMVRRAWLVRYDNGVQGRWSMVVVRGRRAVAVCREKRCKR